MPASKAQQKAVNKYMAANYDRINLTVAKGQRSIIRDHAAARGESVNGFIGRAISETMERDTAGTTTEATGAPSEAGAVSLPPDVQEAAQSAADAAGEALSDFVRRAVAAQAERDALEGTTLMDAAIKAAEATGETPADFIARAIETQAKRDKSSLKMGINPATGGRLEKEA